MSPPPDVSIVIVNYRTPDLIPDCAAALRSDLDTAGLRGELILVDNGGEPSHHAAFEALGLKVLDPGANLGYAGGANLGFRGAAADRLIVMNPDVLVRPGCLAALVESLDAGAWACGPRFFWDQESRCLLPPNEPRRRLWELRASLALTGAFWAGRARRAWRRHARRHWLAQRPLFSFELSGALLALRRDALGRVGLFDEGFSLYFEETDWLHRLRRSGGIAAYVPAAEAVHLYDQSARQEPRAAAWFAESRQRFQARHYGKWFAGLTQALERRIHRQRFRISSQAMASTSPVETAPPSLSFEGLGVEWVEISPREVGFPAAAEPLDPIVSSWRLPQEIWDRMTPGTYWVRGVDRAGREVHSTRFTKG